MNILVYFLRILHRIYCNILDNVQQYNLNILLYDAIQYMSLKVFFYFTSIAILFLIPSVQFLFYCRVIRAIFIVLRPVILQFFIPRKAAVQLLLYCRVVRAIIIILHRKKYIANAIYFLPGVEL